MNAEPVGDLAIRSLIEGNRSPIPRCQPIAGKLCNFAHAATFQAEKLKHLTQEPIIIVIILRDYFFVSDFDC